MFLAGRGAAGLQVQGLKRGEGMKYTLKNDGDQIFFNIEGTLNAESVGDLKGVLSDAKTKWSDRKWVLESGNLDYISSSGLRWLLELRQTVSKGILITGVTKAVQDIFSVTGFDKLFSIERGLRRISVDGCELVGCGANGEVYRGDDETIVKVFYPGEDKKNVEREHMISHVVLENGLPVVIPYDTVEVEGGRYGIVYETLGAKTLSETIEDDPDRFDEWIAKYVDLYRKVHEKDGSGTVLPKAKEVYRRHLFESADWYTSEELDLLLKLLESIPDRNTMIHGDFHPNNIMVNNEELIMIDLGDFSIGHPVFDFLATAATQANLVELSPEYAEFHTQMKAERIRRGWNMLLELYFPDRTPQDRSRLDAQFRLLSRLKVACAPAVAKGISKELMQNSVNDVKVNLIPRIDELLGAIDW